MKTFILLLLTFQKLSSQTGISKVDDFIKGQNLDTFIVYTEFCTGLRENDTCDKNEFQVVFYKKQNLYYKKYFKKCYSTRIDTIQAENPLSFFLTNKQNILKNDINPPTYIEKYKTKKGWKSRKTYIVLSHSCFYKFYLLDKNKIVEKTIDRYLLESKKMEDGKTNIYFNYNQKTKQKELIEITKKFI